MEVIKLTQEEMIRAYTAGIKRQWRHRDPVTGERFSTHRFVAYDTAFQGDIKGCLVEMAVSKYFGTRWNSEDWDLSTHSEHKDMPDVEPHFEVRRCRSLKGELTIRDTDAHHKVAVLGCVDTDEENTVYLLGAIPVAEARKIAIPTKDGNVYVSQDQLHPVKDFVLENA